MLDLPESLDLYTTILRVRDLEVSERWYADVLGMKFIYRDLSYPLVSMVGPGGARLTLWKIDEGLSVEPVGYQAAFPTFVTRDVSTTHAELERKGAKVEPVDSGKSGVLFFWVLDPDGHRLLVLQMLIK